MKLSIQRETLLAALSHCATVVDRKSAHFAASAALLSTLAGGILQVRATDCIAANVRVTLPGVDHNGVAEIAVSAKDLLDRVKAMPAASRVTLETKAESLVITATGSRRFTLRTMPANEMPAWPACDAAPVTMPGAALAAALGTVQHAMRLELDPVAQHGTLLTFDGNTLRADATDGHRLAMSDVVVREGAHRADSSAFSILLAFGAARIVQRLTEGAESVAIAKAGDAVQFRVGAIEFSTLAVNAQFPPTRQIGNVVKPSVKAEVARDTIAEAVRAIALTSESVTLTIAGDALAVSGVSNTKGEEATDSVAAVITGEAAPTSHACNYLLEALDACGAVDIAIEFGPGGLDPLRIKSGGSTLFVMPRRL